MELLPKDFVPELNTKNLGISPRFLTFVDAISESYMNKYVSLPP
jgi:hypothetical protein